MVHNSLSFIRRAAFSPGSLIRSSSGARYHFACGISPIGIIDSLIIRSPLSLSLFPEELFHHLRALPGKHAGAHHRLRMQQCSTNGGIALFRV